MFAAVPALRCPTVATTGSNASNCRATRDCRASTISAATGTGSWARCGTEPCPPRPRTVTIRSSHPAWIAPVRETSAPCGYFPEYTWIAYAASGCGPAASSSPSSIIRAAPPSVSSPGWNIPITSAASSSRRSTSHARAPYRPAVCMSWPHACMVPGVGGAQSSPVSSVTGSPSMSPRSSTTGRRVPAGSGLAPRSTATTELSSRPVLTSSAGPPVRASWPARSWRGASRSRTAAWVRGRCRSSSGWACSSRRRAITSRASSAGTRGARASAVSWVTGVLQVVGAVGRGRPPAPRFG